MEERFGRAIIELDWADIRALERELPELELCMKIIVEKIIEKAKRNYKTPSDLIDKRKK